LLDSLHLEFQKNLSQDDVIKIREGRDKAEQEGGH